MREVVFRAAEAGDVARLTRLVEESPGAPVWSEKIWEQVVGSAADQEHRLVLIAEREGELVGFGVCGAAGEEAEIESLAVSVRVRRQGIGRGLCERLMDWARAGGAEQMLLEVRASNSGARELYRAIGFAEQGIRRGYYREPVEDAVLMIRKL